MKRIYLLLIGFVFILACSETDNVLYDPINGQEAYGFEVSAQTVTVTEEGTTVEIGVVSATRTNADRTIPIAIDVESTGSSDDFTLGSIVIPAGEHVATLEVTFDNFAGMVDCVTNTLILNLEAGQQGVNGAQQVILSYVRDFECPDLFLNIEFDAYPGETTWEVTDLDGNVLFDGDGGDGSPVSENICVCPGEYVFTIFDSFGDGICCAYGEGSYEMVYNGNVLFEGGEFGSSSTHNFIID